MLSMLTAGFSTVFLDPMMVMAIFAGVVIGIIFGALPGLTCVAGLSLLLPVTYAMKSSMGLSMMTALYIGGTSGGLISAILLNIPGTPSSIATCFDGRPLAVNGEAGKALGVGVFSSIYGTCFGIAAMVLMSPTLAAITINFGPWEYFGVTICALTLISSLCGKSLIVGLISAIFGMMFATVGLAPIDSAQRFTFGSVALSSGFSLLTVLVGLYAISEVISSASGGSGKDVTMITDYKIKGLGFTWDEMKTQVKNLNISSVIGLVIGILPGIGGSTSNIVAYSVAKNTSKYPEKFGTGIIDGVVAPESANNASIGGAMIPLLTLGIPGDGSTAILLGAFLLHGLQPGPLLFQTNGNVVYSIFAAMILSTFMMGAIMYLGMRLFVKILKVPSYILMPVIVVLCCIGAFAINSRAFDVWALVAFGMLGIAMHKINLPAPPFILGFLLCEAFETNLRRGLEYSNGNIFELFTRPIALMFIAITVLSVGYSIVAGVKRYRRDLCS